MSSRSARPADRVFSGTPRWRNFLIQKLTQSVHSPLSLSDIQTRTYRWCLRGRSWGAGCGSAGEGSLWITCISMCCGATRAVLSKMLVPNGRTGGGTRFGLTLLRCLQPAIACKQCQLTIACHAGAVANARTDFSPVVGVGLCQASAKFSYTLRWRDGESLEQQSSIWGQEFEYLQARHLQITPSPPKSADSSIEPVKLSNSIHIQPGGGRPDFEALGFLRPLACHRARQAP